MAIDSYSLCPGGTGKKIKFCCDDLLAELKTLDRMMEGEQYVAALRHLESIESPDAPRACLLTLKIQLLRATQRDEDARAAVDHFRKHFPDNSIALAESAINAAIDGDGPAAMQLLQQSLSGSGEELYAQVYGAMSVVAQLLASSGMIRSARALWHLQTMANSNDPHPRELLTKISRSDAVPLLLKDEPPLAECPEDVAWKDQFDRALEPLAGANWAETARRLENLAEQVPQQPAVWQNLAILRSWLADQPGAIAAFEKLASLDIPLEDAVEARATAMLLSDDPLGDATDGLRLTFPVGDADELAGLVSTWKHAVAVPFDAATFREQSKEEVPPKIMFWLLDRPTPDSAEGLTLDTVSTVLGQAMLFGRQTDREARLVLMGATSAQREEVVSLLGQVANGQITGEPEQEVIAQVSATRSLLRRPWRLPPDASRETIRSLGEQNIERTVMEEWPGVKLGVLNGRSAEEVAAEGDKKVLVLATILILEGWIRQLGDPADLNRLRSKLGLPTLGPIDPENISPADLPLVRLHRVMVERLADDALLAGFHRAVVYGAHEATDVFGRELIERPKIADDQKQQALAVLVENERDSDRALGYVERGRQLAETLGQSSAAWDFNELELRMARGEAEEGSRLFEHLRREHLREPGVAEALRDFLIRAGVVDAQGRPVEPELPPDAVPEPPQDEPAAGLWTPDSEQSTKEKPKLWTPDMG